MARLDPSLIDMITSVPWPMATRVCLTVPHWNTLAAALPRLTRPDVIAESGPWEPWLCAPVNLEKGLFHTDFQMDKVHKLEAKYGRAVGVKWLQSENWFLLEAIESGLTIAQLKSEFGLVPLDEYLDRAQRAQRADMSA